MTPVAQLTTDPTLTTVADAGLRVLAFLAILLAGYLLAWALRRAVVALLGRLGVGRALDRGGITAALARSGHDVGTLVSKLVFYGLMLLVLQLAFGVFGPNAVSDLLQRLIAFLPRIAVAIVLVIVAAAVGAAVRDIVRALLGELAYGPGLATAAQLLIVGVGVFAALDQLAVAPTIVTGLFYAVLAIIVGVTVVAVGGGGIVPLRTRWERALTRMDEEGARMRDEARRQREAREEARRRAEAEEEARRQAEAEEEARRQAEAEEEARRQAEAEEEARRQAEAEEEARRQAEAEEEARRRAEVAEDLVIRSTPPPPVQAPGTPTAAAGAGDDGDAPTDDAEESETDPTLAFDTDMTMPITPPPADAEPRGPRGRRSRRHRDEPT